jgi:hypothetical protein
MEVPFRPIHLLQGLAALFAGFFLSIPFVIVLGLDRSLQGRTDEAAVLVLIGASVVGLTSSLMAMPQTRSVLTKPRRLFSIDDYLGEPGES